MVNIALGSHSKDIVGHPINTLKKPLVLKDSLNS